MLSLRDGDLARGTNGDGVAGPAVHLEYPLSPRALALPLCAEVDSQVRARRLDVGSYARRFTLRLLRVACETSFFVIE